MNLTVKARNYGVKELLRRTCLPRDFLDGIEILSEQGVVTLRLPGTGDKRVTFPACANGDVRTATRRLRAAESSLDVIVPFAGVCSPIGSDAFEVLNGKEVRFNADLPGVTTLTLGRYEELSDDWLDSHGRFRTESGVAASGMFLDRPIVDEYGAVLGQAIRLLIPSLAEPHRGARVWLTHDIDEVGYPFRLRRAAGHLLRRKKPSWALRDSFRFLGSRSTDDLIIAKCIREAVQARLKLAVNWKSAAAGKFDIRYDLESVKHLIRWNEENGVENGVHPGYMAFNNCGRLNAELDELRKAFGKTPMGGRQHYLRWSPRTWLDWERCGLKYDSSLGYVETVGFRAGTCVPYRPWLFVEDREATLLEVPLIVMDTSFIDCMNCSNEEALAMMRVLVKRCEIANGVFTVLWHPCNALTRRGAELFKGWLALLSQYSQYATEV
ncbi:MAG: polysaccharide deacetylase family protein [Bryobacteraceae bacterium]|jgi:hypothetical protein